MDVELVSHGETVVDAHKFHVLLEQDNLVDLLEVVDFLYVVVVSSIVLNV